MLHPDGWVVPSGQSTEKFLVPWASLEHGCIPQSHQLRVAAECLQYGWCNWGTERLILRDLN